MDPEHWQTAFIVFVGGLGYLGVHRIVGKSLDDHHSGSIKAEVPLDAPMPMTFVFLRVLGRIITFSFLGTFIGACRVSRLN